MKTVLTPSYEDLKKENFRLKQIVDELWGDHEKYRAIYDHQFNCFYIHDLEGNFLDANNAALKLLGYDRKEIPGLNFSSLIGEDQLPKAFETLEEIKRTGYETQVVEYELRRKDGSRIWIDTGGSLVYEDGNPVAILGVARDITARKQAEADLQKAGDELENRVMARTAELTEANRQLENEIEERRQMEAALEKSERNYRQLVQSANSIILRLDSRGNIKFINELALQFFGYDEDEVLGKNVVRTIVPAAESSGRDLAAMIKDIGHHPERYVNNENENICRNGERVWINWTNRGIQDDKGKISEVLCVGNDRSKRKKAEQALGESEAKFRALAEAAPAATVINYGGKIATLALAYDITERKQAGEALLAREQELKSQTRDLEEMHLALKVLLKKREDDKVVLEINMLSNVEQLIKPYLQNLKRTNLSDRQANLLDIIETNFAEILAPFVLQFSALKYKLTPKEIQVANLIKQGKTNKEIAETMGLSVRTIEFHRTKIRNKFGLKGGKDNLQAHLIAADGL